LTGLIAATVRFIAQRKLTDLLVSFADATQGHHGGIYQAASWNYDGQRDRRMDGLLIDGHFMPGRNANHKWGTRSPTKLLERMPDRDIVPHYDDGKHLYWRALNKQGRRKAERLGLQSQPYIKPGIGPEHGHGMDGDRDSEPSRAMDGGAQRGGNRATNGRHEERDRR
jgi:hypothetical protein